MFRILRYRSGALLAQRGECLPSRLLSSQRRLGRRWSVRSQPARSPMPVERRVA